MERTLSLSGSGRYIKVKFADEDALGTSPVSDSLAAGGDSWTLHKAAVWCSLLLHISSC